MVVYAPSPRIVEPVSAKGAGAKPISPNTDNLNLRALLARERKRERDADHAFVAGIAGEDIAAVVRALEVLRYSIHGGFHHALRAAASSARPSDNFRHEMLGFIIQYGDALRTAVQCDGLLLCHPMLGPRSHFIAASLRGIGDAAHTALLGPRVRKRLDAMLRELGIRGMGEVYC